MVISVYRLLIVLCRTHQLIDLSFGPIDSELNWHWHFCHRFYTNGPLVPQTDLWMEWQHCTCNLMNRMRWLALVLKRTEIQGFTSYPCWITFRKTCFPTNGGCLHIHYFFFKSKKYTQVTVKNKIDAPKENQCTTRWLLNGFLSHEMFNLLFWSRNAFQAEMLNWYSSQFKLTKFWLFILVRKIHILAKKMIPRVFHLDPVFST